MYLDPILICLVFFYGFKNIKTEFKNETYPHLEGGLCSKSIFLPTTLWEECWSSDGLFTHGPLWEECASSDRHFKTFFFSTISLMFGCTTPPCRSTPCPSPGRTHTAPHNWCPPRIQVRLGWLWTENSLNCTPKTPFMVILLGKLFFKCWSQNLTLRDHKTHFFLVLIKNLFHQAFYLGHLTNNKFFNPFLGGHFQK